MSMYRCTQCGARIEAAEGVKVSTCPSCQALFVLPNQFAQKENLYLLASDARHSGNFDMALNYYSRILKVDGAEPEANWGYLLSKYGVELSENAVDYGGVLFHRVEHSSFTKDPAYEKMMTYVPQASRYYYEGTAREIEAQHQKLMAISRTLTAPDIFIDCTAAPGTEDFLLSVQIGKALEDVGYRIFHPAMLQNVERRDLNLYEMAAAEKAQALIVVMTARTNREDARFQAVWRRFLAYRRQDAGRKLLSVFRGIRPEDLPLELQALQSVPCEGSDFQGRIVAEINRMFGRQNRSASLVKENLELLREGEEALGREDYKEARQIFAKAISNDGEEYRAHWGMVRALTQDLHTPLLGDNVDHHYRQAVQYAEKAVAAGYTETMTALMSQAAWDALLEATGQLKDYRTEEKPEAVRAEKRVKLYLPAFDSCFQQLEDWHTGCKRQQELDAVEAAYKRRDTAVQPLFAEQEKIEYAYANTALSHSDRLDEGGLRARLLGGSIIAMLLSYFFLLINFGYTTGYDTGYYKVSVICFVGGLALVVFWARRLYDETWILPVGALAIILLFSFTRSKIRPVHLFLILLPVVLFLADRAMMMVLAKNARDSLRLKQRAAGAVAEMEGRIRAAYQTDMEKIYAKYKLPGAAIPELTVPHSEHYTGLGQHKKEASPAGYALRTLAFFAVVIAVLTFGSNRMYASGWNHIVKIDNRYYHVVGLRENGTVKANGLNDAGQCDVSGWKDVIDVGAGRYYTAGLTSEGTVLIAGAEDEAIREAENWTDIAAISVGGYHIVGLKNDGTVVSAGADTYGENAVQDWTDIVQIQAVSDNNLEQTYGLRSDGKIFIAGGESYDRIREVVDGKYGPEEGQIRAERLYGFTESILVLGEDGNVTGIGNNAYYQLSQAEEWSGLDLADIAVSSGAGAMALKTDGSVVWAGNNALLRDSVSSWSGITDISLGMSHALGLRDDGTVIAVGSNTQEKLDTDGWKNVTDVTVGDLTSYGIQENGHVEAAGYSIGGLTYLKAKSPLGVLRFWYESLKW